MRRFLTNTTLSHPVRGFPPPDSIGGLIVWLTGDALNLSNGAPVTSLVDISGNNVPVPLDVRSTGVPVLSAASAHGHDGVLFGSQQGFRITDATALTRLASVGLTTIAVVRTPAVGTAHVWGGGNASDTFYQEAKMISVFTQLEAEWSSTDFQFSINAASPVNTLSVLTVRKRADYQECRVNTVVGAVTGNTPFPTPIALAQFGVWCYADPLFFDGSEPMTGYEFCAYDSYVADGQLENVERGLMIKYGIS